MNKPSVIDNNFLNQVERNDIKHKVLALKSLWKSIVPSKEQFILCSMLPAGMYSNKYDSQGIVDSNMIMMGKFSAYYNKLKNTLASYYQRPVNFHPNLQLPGFHVFSNTKDTTSFYSKVNFHIDFFKSIENYMVLGTMESIIIPIELPESGGSLIYNTTRPRDSRYVANIATDERFNYTLGMIAVWPGNLMHSIGPITLSPTEHRITMQMHINLTDRQGIVFW